MDWNLGDWPYEPSHTLFLLLDTYTRQDDQSDPKKETRTPYVHQQALSIRHHPEGSARPSSKKKEPGVLQQSSCRTTARHDPSLSWLDAYATLLPPAVGVRDAREIVVMGGVA